LLSSSTFVEVIKSRRLRWERLVPPMEEMRNAYKILVANPKGRDHLEELDIDAKILLK
jgi:hypothetical protein